MIPGNVPTEIALERALELDLERALETFQRELAERGITAEVIIADIEWHKDETLRDFYPDAEGGCGASLLVGSWALE
jgi:hypothetical protein